MQDVGGISREMVEEEYLIIYPGGIER